MVSNDIFDLQDFYEEYSNEEGEFRICEVCGKPYDEGYMTEGGTFYACSDECFCNDADARYGKGKWKRTEELTEEEKKNVELKEKNHSISIADRMKNAKQKASQQTKEAKKLQKDIPQR